MLQEQLPFFNKVTLGDNEELAEEEYQCGVSKVYCYLSQVVGSCTSNIVCPAHFRDICDCDISQIALRMRMSDEDLEDLGRKVHEKETCRKLGLQSWKKP
jgi:histone demethylase JARID1